jgi:hypothetical protein
MHELELLLEVTREAEYHHARSAGRLEEAIGGRAQHGAVPRAGDSRQGGPVVGVAVNDPDRQHDFLSLSSLSGAG